MKLLSILLLSISALSFQAQADENFLCSDCQPTKAPVNKACPECPPTQAANEVFSVGHYTNCQPTYTQEFNCVLERGGTFWLKDGSPITHNQVDNITASWNIPMAAQYIQGSGWLKVYLVDTTANTIDLDQPLVKVTQALNFRTISTYNLNSSVLFGANVFTNGKAACDQLAAAYMQVQSFTK